MIHDDLLLHNVVELEPAEAGGVYLRRFPRAVRDAMIPLGRMVSLESAGCEIRFVTEASSFRLSVSTLPSVLAPYELHNQDLFIFRGSFVHSHHRLRPGQINHINVVNIGNVNPFEPIRPESARQCGFAPQVWRVLLGRYPAVLYGLDTYGHARRPPQPDELPTRRWLAYGSSITHGASPTVHLNAYIYHAARLAGLDVLNQGLSGSCHAEPQVADYLAGRGDVDVYTLEMGVNMRGGFTADQFRERAGRLVDTLLERRPEAKVVLVTVYPNAATPGHSADPDRPATRIEPAFCDVLRQIVATRRRPNLTLLEGGDVLQSLGDTTVDLIHPSDYGHAAMGLRLGEHLRSLPG